MSYDARSSSDPTFRAAANKGRISSARPSWKASILLAIAAAYLPYGAMAIYMTAFISCSHCKSTSWMLAPLGPGMVPTHLFLQTTNIGRLGDGWEFAIAACISLVILMALVLVSRIGPVWRAAVLLLALAVNSLCAVAIYSMIRA